MKKKTQIDRSIRSLSEKKKKKKKNLAVSTVHTFSPVLSALLECRSPVSSVASGIKKRGANGHMTVARGMGGEGSVGCVANGHMTVGRWGKGGRGRGGGGTGKGRKGEGGGGGGGGGGEEEREGGWGVGPARGGGGEGGGGAEAGGGEGGERRGPGGGPGVKPVGWPRALKKIEIRPGPAL